jgi:hypothetical protein
MSEISEALDAWREARRALEATTPWTAEWQRARLAETDARAAYEAVVEENRERLDPTVDRPVPMPEDRPAL